MKTQSVLPYLLLFVFLGLTTTLSAQQELLLHQQSELWQSTATNPAFFPKEKKIVIGLPSFGLDFAHSGDITYNDLLRKQGDRTVLDLGGAISKLDPENEANYNQRFETVSLGLRLPGKFFLQASHAVRQNMNLNYPKTLADLFWYGNAPYIGEQLSVGFSADVYKWNELSLGLSRNFFDKLSIGVRAKYLSGTSSFQTDNAHQSIQVFTDPDIYQLTLNTDYGFYSSSMVSAIDTNGLGFDLALNKIKNSFSDNSGFAFDLGLQMQLGERLTISASVLDLGGKINWKKNSNYFISNGSYDYDGVGIPGADIINGTVDSLDFTAALDTLNDVFQFQKTPGEFSSTLPTRIYVGGTYQLTKRWTIGAVLHHQNSERHKATSVGVNAHWSILKWLTVGGMYSINDQSAANIGLSVVAKPGPVQVFILSDNALNAVTPFGSAAVNFRFGGALMF